MVIDILVPVSPSGTGNTFNSLIHSFFASKFFAPAKKALARTLAFIVVISTLKSSLINHAYAFDVNVNFLDLHSGKFLNLILHGLDQVIGNRADADAVLSYDNMKINRDFIVLINRYIYSMCQIIPF